jgi:hypothetical protein
MLPNLFQDATNVLLTCPIHTPSVLGPDIDAWYTQGDAQETSKHPKIKRLGPWITKWPHGVGQP